MAYAIELGNTTQPLRFLMVLSADHVTGATGLTPTVTIAKNDGLGFASPLGAVSELGSGWYSVAANATDANTLGPISLHATGAGADPADADATGELDWIVGCTYTGQPTEQAEVRNLMGCNMSFRREVFERVGGFAEDIGRIGRYPLGCEETELCIRARQVYGAAGEKIRIVFDPRAVVDHRVSDDRVGWAYLRRRCWAEGLSKAAVSKLVGSEDALSTERGYVARILPAAVRRELGRRQLTSAAAVVVALGFTSAGYLRGKLPGATAGVRLPAAGG